MYKKLAGQTIIYGFGTVIPRILNYSILTIYYTRLFSVQQFGVITELYAYIAFLMIILTYGTETGYFRFADDKRKNVVFGSLIYSLLLSSLVFIVGSLLFRKSIASAIEYKGNVEYISILAVIVGIDAFSAIPFAKLRREERGKKFAVLKILNVLITIICVLFFYEILPRYIVKSPLGLLVKLRTDVTYVLISNLIASSIVLILLLPEIIEEKLEFDNKLLKEVLKYSWPLLIAGLAGTINESLDRVLLKHLISDKNEALYALGIYGANYRIAVLLLIFIQMFRYAMEPFYFSYYGKSDEKKIFAQIMRLFIGIAIVISMIMLFYLDYVKYFIPPKYHEGLKIVPIVLIGYILYGIFFNQSMWYKFTKNTSYAILLTLIGAGVTIAINIIFVKKFSYYASAVAHICSYGVMIVLSYSIGRKYYKIDYNLPRIAEYIILALLIFAFRLIVFKSTNVITNVLSAILVILYTIYILWREKLVTNFNILKWK